MIAAWKIQEHVNFVGIMRVSLNSIEQLERKARNSPTISVCMYVAAPIYSLRSYIQQVYLYSYRLTIKHFQR